MLRNIFCILTIGLLTPVMFPWVVATMVFTLSTDTGMWWVQKVWSRAMIFASGAKIEVVGGVEHLDPSRPVIFLSNHLSTLDIPVLFIALWPVRFRFVAKKVIKYVPVLGWFIWMAGFIFIDRGRTREAIASLDKAGEKIRRGTSIVLFPEGTRSPEGFVLPFKKGPFMLALKAGVPVVPISIVGTREVQPKNSWNITPGPVKVMIGKPIDVAAYAQDRDGLMKLVRDTVIDQSLALGGKGGEKDPPLARGREESTPRPSQTEASA